MTSKLTISALVAAVVIGVMAFVTWLTNMILNVGILVEPWVSFPVSLAAMVLAFWAVCYLLLFRIKRF